MMKHVPPQTVDAFQYLKVEIMLCLSGYVDIQKQIKEMQKEDNTPMPKDDVGLVKLCSKIKKKVKKGYKSIFKYNPEIRKDEGFGSVWDGSMFSNFFRELIADNNSINWTISVLLINKHLYPLQGEKYQLWNQHVQLLNQWERESIKDNLDKLNQFLQEHFKIQCTYSDNEQTKREIYILNILFIILHLDALLVTYMDKQKVSIFQVLLFYKYKQEKTGNIILQPSKNLADFIRYVYSNKPGHLSPQDINSKKYNLGKWVLDILGKGSNESFLQKRMADKNNKYCSYFRFVELLGGFEEVNDKSDEEIFERIVHLFKTGETDEQYDLKDSFLKSIHLIYSWVYLYACGLKKSDNCFDTEQFKECNNTISSLWKPFYQKYQTHSESQEIIFPWPKEWVQFCQGN